MLNTLPVRPKIAQAPIRVLAGVLLLVVTACGRDPDVVIVGSKNFSESIILGEIIAQELERRGVEVVRKHNLGGSFVCHQALISGELDAYVEYTGTAYAGILQFPAERDPETVRRAVDSVYAERWNVHWAEPLGFSNTFAMLIRGKMARRLNITTLSEAVPLSRDWRGGYGFEFSGRADGLVGFLAWYGFEFDKAPSIMELGLIYRALADSSVDLIAGNSTDGQIETLDLFQLEDDRNYFPPYEAIPVVRTETLDRHSAMSEVLSDLAGVLDETTMRRLNTAVDAERRPVPEVVGEFLDGLRNN